MSQILDVRRAAGPLARGGAGELHIGRWRLVRLLGEGQWTRVYQASPLRCSPDGPADYALKLAKAEPNDTLAIGLVQREAYVGRLASHPHLAPVLCAHVDRPPFYLVMPRLDGATLQATLHARGPLSPPRAIWIARQVAEALQALHQHGWLHADVKPSNIFVSPLGHVTLIDLGLAQRLDDLQHARRGTFAGTAAYAAPEMFSSAMRADSRSDIYSLGATFYEMLTGRLPFSHEQPGELATAHLQQAPQDPRCFVPQLPRGAAQLVKRMLAKEPLRRPDAAELTSLLVRLEIETFSEDWPATAGGDS